MPIANPCCCACTTICSDPFTRANSADPNTSSPAGCGWSIISGTWNIVSNGLECSTDNSRLTSLATIPTDFTVRVSASAAVRDEFCLYLDDRKITFCPGNSGQLALITYNDNAGNITTTVNTSVGDSVRAVVIDGYLYVQTIAFTTVTNLIKVAIGSVSSVGIGTGSVTGTVTFDNFLVKTAGTGTSCDAFADPDQCSIFSESWKGHNGESVLGDHWLTQSGTITTSGIFGTHYLTLTNASIETQPLYIFDTGQIDQYELVFNIVPDSGACSATVSLGGVDFVLDMYGGGCCCVTVGDMVRQYGFDGGLFTFLYDVSQSTLSCSALGICRPGFTWDIPTSIEITATGAVRIDEISFYSRRDAGSNPSDCTAVATINCDCLTLNHFVCGADPANACDVDFTGSWSYVSATNWQTTDGSCTFIPTESFDGGYGCQFVQSGVRFSAEGDKARLYSSVEDDNWVELVCGAVSTGDGATIQVRGGDVMSVSLKPSADYRCFVQHSEGWLVGLFFHPYFGSGPLFTYYAYNQITLPAGPNHGGLAADGTVNFKYYAGLDTSSSISEIISETTNDTCLFPAGSYVGSYMPTVCTVSNTPSIMATIDYTFPAGCACTSGHEEVECVFVSKANETPTFIGTVTTCGFDCVLTIVMDDDGDGMDSAELFGDDGSGDAISIVFAGGDCSDSIGTVNAYLWCDSGGTMKTGSATIEVTV